MTPKEYAELAVEKLKNETRMPILHIDLTDTKTSIFESKIGGIPYLPKDEEIPLGKNGRQMKLLAQFNCKDFEPLKDYPHSGILQFWLTTDFAWEEYTVKFYGDNIDYSLTENDVIPRIADFVDGKDGCFPVNGEYGVEFTPDEETISYHDERLKTLFCQYYTEISGEYISDPEDAGDEVYEVFEEYTDDAFAYGSKIGGYELRTQLVDYLTYRPENYDRTLRWSKYKQYISDIDIKSDNEDLVLFQLDSHYSNSRDYRVLWGDAGVAHFSITRGNLKAGNLEAVSFYWDCS